MKKLQFISISLLLSVLLHAQPDMQRMEKDIDVFTKVLNELFRDNSDPFAFGQASSDGTYVPGYGVIIQVPVQSSPGNFSFSFDGELEEALAQTRISIQDLNKVRNIKEAKKQSIEKGDDKSPSKSAKAGSDTLTISSTSSVIFSGSPGMVMAITPNGSVTSAEVMEAWAVQVDQLPETKNDSLPVKRQQEIIAKMKQALEQYGDLMGQLQENERILLVYDESARSRTNSFFFRSSGARSGNPRITVDVKRGDLQAFTKGSIRAEEFRERMRVTSDRTKEEMSSDCRIFGGILQTLLGNTEEAAYTLGGAVNYTYLPGFGVIYYTRMRHMEMKHVDPGAKAGESKEKELQELQKAIKRNLLDYGRALKSLANDQFILLNVELVQGHETTATLSFRLKKEVIVQYERKEITEDKAWQSISVNLK